MSRGTARGIASGFLGLVALQALSTRGGSGRVAEAFGDIAGLVARVMDPDVPAIPDRRAGAAQGTSTPGSIAAAKAAGGAQGTTSSRLERRLPIPDPPQPPNK